jgi:molybdopterin-guanine dinucleotide biosynthesis protein A
MVEKVELPPAVILAGGLSRRMGGGDKGLLKLGTRSILGHVIDRIRPQAWALALNANGDASRFAGFGLPVIPDLMPGFPGPLAGFLAALSWAAGHHPLATHVLTAPSDTPFLPRDLVARLRGAIGDSTGSAMAARACRNHPVVGLWPVGWHAPLRAAVETEGLRKVEAWTDRMKTRAVGFDDTPFDPFFNVNTPDDLAAAEERLALNP